MAKIGTRTRNDIALMAKVFDFLNQLDDWQVADLLEGKVALSLETALDERLDSLIDKKVAEKIAALAERPAPRAARVKPTEEPAKKPAKKAAEKVVVEKPAKAPKAPKDKAPKDKAPAQKAPTQKASNQKADYEAIAADIRKLTTADDITNYFNSSNLRVSMIKMLGRTQFGIENTRPMDGNSIKQAIIGAVVK